MPEKKKILHIIQSLDNGGCENMLLRTLPLLTGDFEHQIITLRELGELAPQFTAKNIAITTIHHRGLFDIFGHSRLIQEVKKQHPDVILSYLFHADMIGRLIVQPCIKKSVVPFLRTTYNHPRYLMARLLEWLTKPLVKQYLANSEAVKQFYIDHIGVNGEKITVIPNGIDVEYFDSLVPDPALRTSLGIEPNDFVIICVANLHSNKGHRYLLEAFEQVFKTHPPIHLLIVGDGNEKANLLNQASLYISKNHIHFLGRRSDVPQLLKISDCFVLPTLFEGQSNAIMEAMAIGLPVITTDIPENKIIITNKETGYFVQARSSENIKEMLLEIFKNKDVASEKGRLAKKSIEKSFSLAKSLESLKIFLHSL